MNIACLPLGSYQTNCYVVTCDQDPEHCLIIDPGLGAEALIEYLQQQSLRPTLILLTHGHGDHIGGVDLVCQTFPDIKVYISKPDVPMLTSATLNLSVSMDAPSVVKQTHHLYEEGDMIEFANLDFHVIATPGHTPGGICLYCPQEAVLFAGDALFAGGIGRTDFHSGNHEQLVQNIQEKLLSLPPETQVFPGHGPATTIEREKNYNPFL